MKKALVPSELKSNPREGCERELEAMAMNAAAASTEMEKDSILKSEERVKAAKS